MIDFAVLTEYFVLVVMLACLCLGYIIKTSFDFIPNKYIPTILAVVGAVLNAVVSGACVESVVYGATMGLASTGLYEAFRNFVEGKRKSEEE
jgi:hypothetical protein